MLPLYCHYDGQAVDPAKRVQPDPFEPVIRGGRLSGQSRVVDFTARVFVEALGAPAVGVHMVNFDNNRHSRNENIRLGYFIDSIVTFAAIFTM